MSKPENHPASQSDATSTSAGADYSFDETTLHRIWRENSRTIIIGCAIVLVVILGRGGWEYFSSQHEQSIRADYAAATTSEKLKAFADANPGHSLAGVARLRLADEAYTAGKGAEAQAAYEAAVPLLKGTILADRAQLGLAMSRVLAGRTADGEAALKELLGRADAAKGVRCEAAYNLASLAQTAGRPDDVAKYADQLMQIDAGGPWAQRAQMLRLQSSISNTAATKAPATAPASSSSEIKLNLPAGK